MASNADNMMDEKALRNGLRVIFHDQSRPVAGGRWQVTLRISIHVPILLEYFKDCPDPTEAYSEFTTVHGTTLEFRQIKVRNFTAEEEKENLMALMKEEFLQANTVYLENPQFPLRFVMKAYRDWMEKNAWKKAYHATLGQSPE